MADFDPRAVAAHAAAMREGGNPRGSINPHAVAARVQELRNPSNVPMPGLFQSGTVDDPSKAASFWTTLKASLHPGVQKKIEQYALDRGIPIERYGVDKGGNVVYFDPDTGRLTREIPSVGGASGIVDFLGRLGQNIGAEVGPGISQGAGTTAGALTAAAGHPAAAVPVAGAVSSGVDLLRQGAGNLLLDKGPLEDLDYSNAAGQGLLATTGQGAASLAARRMTKNPLRVSGQDVSRLRDPAEMAKYQAAQQRAQRVGIQTTPAEATGARSLLQNQRQLGRLPESADIMSDFQRMRNTEQIPAALDRTLDRISPVSSSTEGAARLQAGADKAIRAAKKARSVKADPFYRKAYDANPAVASRQIDRILDTPAGREALTIARERVQNRMSLMGIPDRELGEIARELAERGQMAYPEGGVARGLKLATLDLVKQSLDDMIGQAQKGAKTGQVRDGVVAELVALKKGLTRELDRLDASKGLYKRARGIFEENSPIVTDLRDGLVGIVAKGRKQGQQNIPRTFFDIGSANPAATGQARMAFEKAGRIEDWNAGLRAYLADSFDYALKNVERTGNVSAKFINKVWGTPKQRQTLRAAMTPEQWQVMSDLMDTLGEVARALPEGSPTATDIGSRAGFAGPAARGTARVVRGFSVTDIGNNVADFALDFSAGRNADKMARIITSPDAIAELKKLKTVGPKSRAAMSILGNVLTNLGFAATGAREPEPMTPPMFSSAP